MRLFNFFVWLTFLAAHAAGANYTLVLKPEETRIQWTLGDVLHTVHGTFHLKSAAIAFDPDTGKASGEIAVDVTSGESGNHARDRRMHKNVLESDKFPEAVFVPDRLEGQLTLPGVSSAKLHGQFRIHGASHEMSMNLQTNATAGQMHAEITFDVPYVAWGMKDPSTFLLKVSKTVQVSVQAVGLLKKEEK